MLKEFDGNGVPYPAEAPKQETLTVPQALGKACVLCNGINGVFDPMNEVWSTSGWEYQYPEQYKVHTYLDQCSPEGTLVVQVVEYVDNNAGEGHAENRTGDEYRALIVERGGYWTQENAYAVEHMAARVDHDERRYTTYWAD